MAEPFIGQVMLVGWNFAARGWALCDGQLLPISQYSAVFSLLGTTFGGDGRNTFGLPDLRGRVPVHVGNGPGLASVSWGEKAGVNDVTLNTTQIPSHNHSVTLRAENRNGNETDPTNNMLAAGGSYRAQVAADDVSMNPAAITQQNVGGNLSHTNMQPFLGMYYEIALQRIFPSRS